ncbi:peptidylprolyl isomerase [Jatrophihabitans sp.]|uniref:peptidylprolyl isomerase n=1 Tax=Jatrophihabitans sp. TaxID=1932789 RepID=UPI002CAC405A|nr:peptidylprolyl isomerase [Jatrophihabitans sp.]
MPNSKQRREQARRHLERQLVRRQQRDLRRRKMNLIATVVGVLVLFAVVVGTVVLLSDDNSDSTANPAASDSTSASPTASGSPLPSRAPSPIAARAAKKTSGPCGYAEDAGKLTAGNLFDVGLPPDPKPTPTGKATAVFTTNQGTITVTLEGASAPCNVQSIEYLISKKFYDNTACPRSVNSGIFVVQCGDPSATTSGGPTYTTKDENLTKASYTEGTLAMANSGPNTNGSQFFFITKDSNGALGKNYTVIGHVTGGLNVLKKVAEGGDDGSNQAGGGKPNIPLIFKTVTLKS